MMEEDKNNQDKDVDAALDEALAASDVEENAVETPEPANDGADAADGELEKLRAENAELKDRLMRSLAEVENVRRRAEKERQDQSKYGVSPLAKELLPVADNLKRALESIPAELKDGNDQVKNFVMGVEMTEKQLADALTKAGIERVHPEGEKFDYRYHQAMSEAKDTGLPNGTVVQVLQDGYVLADRLLRPAMVIVAKGEPKQPDEVDPVDTTA